MKIRHSAVFAFIVALVSVASPVAIAAQGDGSVRVTINTPVGVPGNVLLKGKTLKIAAKPPTGTSTATTLTMSSGAYHVDLPRVTYGGAVYVAQSSRPEVVIRPGQQESLDVVYVAEEGSRALHATAVTPSSVALKWTAPDGSRFSLRRTTGLKPALHRSDGVEVPTSGTTALDQGLKPGAQYSYALFTQNKSRWYGPLAILVGTAPAAGSVQASYIASPSTLLLQPPDIVSVVATGAGVRLVLQNHMPTPLLGAGVTLPISTGLPGGFLGVVTTLSDDGSTLGLTAGGLSDAFDYYEIAVDDLSTGLAQPVATQLKSASAAKAAAIGPGCVGGSASSTVSFAPNMSLAGHFKTKVDKYSILGADIPVGASLDMGITASVTGAAKVETSGSIQCGLELPKLFKTLTITPVPISISLTPTAQFSIGSAVEVSNVGLTASAGVQVAGSMSLKNGASFSGKAVMNVTPLAPQVKVNGSVGFKVGGELILGPGVGTADAGVIAGIGGELNPLDASFKPYFAASDPRFNACTVTEAAFTRNLSLVAKAWIGNWDISHKITLDALTGSTRYFGSPWYLPSGCKDLPGGETPSSLLGTGVTKVSDSTVGSPDQWGHVDGFAPGKKTWVLSTGMISNAIGAPSQFASTNLGRDGDAAMTALAGFPTFDAASYEVTILPAGANLHVKYVFASEEYPEFVGSSFNDVMAVWVNGKNCATVPGTGEAVSINTINDKKNSTYYVDNAAGAAGYSTSMDGLTIPLTCSVPVTPGQPVTVRISVADTSDHIYDSAVALLDGGIWTD